MFLLRFGIFAEPMFLAGAEEKQRGGGNCGDQSTKPKMHNAPASYSGKYISRKVKALAAMSPLFPSE